MLLFERCFSHQHTNFCHLWVILMFVCLLAHLLFQFYFWIYPLDLFKVCIFFERL